MLSGVIGNFRILDKLGSGGMGVVYKALDIRLNRPVAIKTFLEPSALGAETIANLQREARAIASIDHPYICKVYELLELEGRPLIVMEFLEGQTLAHRIIEGVPPVAETVHYAIEICEALSEAHAKHIVHRDIKPSNIMITVQKHVKVMDFGMAKVFKEDPQSAADPKTLSSEILEFAGTPWYMSPEQIVGGNVNPRSDIYSLGIVIYQCLTGALPFAGNSKQSYLQNSIVHAPRPLRRLSPNVSAELESIVLRCIEKDPSRRFESAADLVSTLSRLQRDESTGLSVRLKDKVYAIGSLQKLKRVFLWIGIAAGAILLSWLLGSRYLDRRVFPEPKNLSSLITWPSAESNSRISPDNQWVSFLSDRDGKKGIWIHNRSGGDPKPIATQEGTIVSHIWSPEGNRLAYLMQTEGKTLVHIIPAFFGGASIASFDIPKSVNASALVRWIGPKIYVEMENTLGRIDTETGGLENLITSSRLGFDFCREFDVRSDERAVVFSARLKGREDLWMTDLTGANAARLTDDPFADRRPHWMGKDGRSLVFQSNRGGQIDLWQMRIADGTTHQVTFSGAAKYPDDISLDGSVLTFQQTEENANLWCSDPKTQNHWQWTADTLKDYWPSISDAASLVAFQRNKPTRETGYEVYDGRIFINAWKPREMARSPQPVDDGYGARLSPDGRWLASLRWLVESRLHSQLWVRDLKTQQARRLTDRFPTPGHSFFPVDWTEANTAWTRDSSYFYFVEFAANGIPQIRKFRDSAEGVDSEIIVAGKLPAQRIFGFKVSDNDNYLSYVLWPPDKLSWEVHALALRNRIDRVIAAVPRSEKVRPFLCGWLKGDESVLFLTTFANADGTQQIEINRADLSGKSETLGRANRAFGSTARFDGGAQVLYITLAENSIHNLYAFQPTRRTFSRLTDNQLPNVTFSGIEFTKDGTLLYSRTETKQDIWIIQFDR